MKQLSICLPTRKKKIFSIANVKKSKDCYNQLNLSFIDKTQDQKIPPQMVFDSNEQVKETPKNVIPVVTERVSIRQPKAIHPIYKYMVHIRKGCISNYKYKLSDIVVIFNPEKRVELEEWFFRLNRQALNRKDRVTLNWYLWRLTELNYVIPELNLTCGYISRIKLGRTKYQFVVTQYDGTIREHVSKDEMSLVVSNKLIHECVHIKSDVFDVSALDNKVIDFIELITKAMRTFHNWKEVKRFQRDLGYIVRDSRRIYRDGIINII